jgi:uncharacterized membrane protein YphA (DoxX/SURF4 family)
MVFLVLRILLGGIFVWASLPKIADPQGFADIISNYQLLPPAMVNPAAVGLPWVEGICGILLISGRLVRGSALLVVVMMAVFTLVTVLNMVRGLDVSCGCFSVAAGGNAGSQGFNLFRNFIFLAVGIFVLARATAGARAIS